MDTSTLTFDTALSTLLTEAAAGRVGVGRTMAHGRELTVDMGRVYARVMALSGSSRCVVAFVERSTGDIYAPAGWKGPIRNWTRGNVYSIAIRALSTEPAQIGWLESMGAA